MPNPFGSRHDRDDDRPIEINVNLKSDASGTAELKQLIKAISAQLTQVKGLIMTTSAEFTAAFERVNVATSAIAEKLRSLEIKSGMTSAEEDAAKAQLDALASSLEAMAATPTDPVPVPVPDEPPVTP